MATLSSIPEGNLECFNLWALREPSAPNLEDGNLLKLRSLESRLLLSIFPKR